MGWITWYDWVVSNDIYIRKSGTWIFFVLGDSLMFAPSCYETWLRLFTCVISMRKFQIFCFQINLTLKLLYRLATYFLQQNVADWLRDKNRHALFPCCPFFFIVDSAEFYTSSLPYLCTLHWSRSMKITGAIDIQWGNKTLIRSLAQEGY